LFWVTADALDALGRAEGWPRTLLAKVKQPRDLSGCFF
jgi:hypothetical protein